MAPATAPPLFWRTPRRALNRGTRRLILGFLAPLRSGFKTARVISFDVAEEDEGGGLSLSIQTQVTNPGSASARLGKIAFDVVYEGQVLGSVTADVDVKPGIFPASTEPSILNPTPDLEAV